MRLVKENVWPFSPSCIFVFKICFRFIAESILFISCVTGNFPYIIAFSFNCFAQKEPAVCQQGFSTTLNNKLCFNIYSNTYSFFLFYIPKPPFN